MRNPFRNSYEKLAASPDYKKVELALRVVKIAMYALSGVATALVNGISHRDVIGVAYAWALGVATFLVVEVTLLALDHGLRTCFRGGSQRFWAFLTKLILQATVIANIAWLATYIKNVPPPYWIDTWSKWSIAVHATVALILVPIIHNADPVVARRMLELRTESAHDDLSIARLVWAVGLPFTIISAKLRGLVDNVKLANDIRKNEAGFNRGEYLKNLNDTARRSFSFVEGGRQLGPSSNTSGDLEDEGAQPPGNSSGRRRPNIRIGDPRGN